MANPQNIATEDDARRALAEPRAILFKYGTRCPISAAAVRELGDFVRDSPDAVVYQVAVDQCRDVSDFIAEQLGVEHESPQAFLLCDGDVRWQATHFSIVAEELATQWTALGSV